MDKTPPFLPADLVQTHPGLSLLRLAALMAEGGEADEETLDLMFEQMEIGALDSLSPPQMWAEMARGLMAPAPQRMVKALRECGVLEVVLPEVDALFGVPQITDTADEIDLGVLILNSLGEAARRQAPLAVRFALLVMHAGKADSPREHLPVHYRHMERGAPRIADISARFAVPADCRDLAVLALNECERVHRTSQMRAGPVAAMLERIGAFSTPDQFEALLQVATCDYFGYADKDGDTHPKVELLKAARAACDGVEAEGLDAEDLGMARARAIADAFRSERWAESA
ncbi:tRNA nucleotidyltransferase [Xanthobacter autotrophicus DSM 431]|uniref:tRNA nucleotidyltransferase n=1 Tax=Xanthobacter nonsaccharivorans TaxID=3119912 RepID=UPI0037295CA1